MPATAVPRRRAAFTWLAVVFGVAVPLVVVVVLGRQVARTGNVSHWPWEEYGFFGWWLVPLSMWIAAACALFRGRNGRAGRTDIPTKSLLVVSAAMSLALLYNP